MLLWIILLWTWVYKYLFRSFLSVLLGMYPEVELLDHVVILFLIFWVTTTILFPTVAVPFYGTINSKQVFHFLHILANTYFFWFCFCFAFRVTPTTYGSYQAKGWIRDVAVGLCHSHSNVGSVGSEPHLWPTPQLTSNAGSLTFWVRPGIEPESWWIPVRFLNHWAMKGPPVFFVFFFW